MVGNATISLKSQQQILVKYEINELTSRLSYETQRFCSRREAAILIKEVEAWRSWLVFPTYDVTKSTLVNTTQMVQTLQAETRDYMSDH